MNDMRDRGSIWFFLVVLALLDWAALDDITTGREPNFVLEWAMLLISVPIAYFLVVRLRPDRPGKTRR